MTLQQLREQRAQVVADMTAIVDAADAEDRDLTADETELFDAYKADLEKLDARIGRREEVDGHAARLEQPQPTVSGNQAITHPPAPEASREFETFGEFMSAVRFNPNDQRLSWFENEAVRGEQRMDEGASGGFAVPTQFRNDLRQVTPQQAIIRPRAEVIPAGSPPDSAVTLTALDQGDAQNMYGGVEVKWIGEGKTKPETTANLREITLTPQEVAATITVTDKLLRNWPAGGSLLQRQLRGAIAASEDDAFLKGDGVAKPMGFLNANAAYLVNRATANQIAYDDLVKMLARIRGSAVFTGHKSILPQLMNMEDTSGRKIWQPSAREGEPDMLFGRPLLWNERAPNLGSKGDLSLTDLSHYLIKDGSGPFVAASEHVHFTENKTVIKAFWNVDGQSWLAETIKDESGYEVSPFVVLDVPA